MFMLRCKKFIDFFVHCVIITQLGRSGTPTAPLTFEGPQHRGQDMINNLEDIQKFSKEHMELAVQTAGGMSKSLQAIAAEVADYQKKSFEEGTAAVEKIVSAKSLDKAFEAQTEYFKTAYEGAVSQFTKIGEMYTDLTKDMYKPYEGVLGKTAK